MVKSLITNQSSHCGAMRSAASWERWDADSILSQAGHRGLGIQRCCSCDLGCNYVWDLIPGTGTHVPQGSQKKI